MGYVYILQNDSFTDLIKIGHTTRSIEERVKELNRATGVPTPFRILHYWEIEDSHGTEQFLHNKFNVYRVNDNREFFFIDCLDEIKKTIQLLLLQEKHNKEIESIKSEHSGKKDNIELLISDKKVNVIADKIKDFYDKQLINEINRIINRSEIIKKDAIDMLILMKAIKFLGRNYLLDDFDGLYNGLYDSLKRMINEEMFIELKAQLQSDLKLKDANKIKTSGKKMLNLFYQLEEDNQTDIIQNYENIKIGISSLVRAAKAFGYIFMADDYLESGNKDKEQKYLLKAFNYIKSNNISESTIESAPLVCAVTGESYTTVGLLNRLKQTGYKLN